jgi:hypothetical protein
MHRSYRPALLALIPLAALLSSCPSPLTEDIVLGARDTEPPVISISSPAEYSSYSRVIRIEGMVSDTAGAGRAGRIDSLSYEILSHTASKPASVAADGSFVIEEPNDLRTNVTVLLRAIDWNGNQTETRLPLVYPGNDIPSFTVQEGSRTISLSWQPVAGATNYRLYVEPSGKTPEPGISTSYNGVSSPYTLGQLTNGAVYSLLLEADGPGGRMNYSQVIRSVPLSTMHLLPRAVERYDGIALSWRSYESIPSYTVLRSASPNGPWADISGPVAGSSFFDAGASGAGRLYYRIKPTARSSVMSEYIEAAADSVSARQDAPVAAYDGLEYSRQSAYKDGYLFVADYYGGLRVLDVRNPALPALVATLNISSVRSLHLHGDYVYIGGGRATGDPDPDRSSAFSLFIVDVSMPTAPLIVGWIDLDYWSSGAQPESVAVLGNLAFVAAFNDGVYVIDVTDKANPLIRIKSRDKLVVGQAYDVAVQNRSGTRLVAVAGNIATTIYTVTGTDASPTLTRNSSSIAGNRSVAFPSSGTVLYTSGGSSFRAWQTSNPASPTQLSTVDPAGSSVALGELTVSGSRVFVAMNIYGYAIVDVSNPSTLRTAFTRSVPGQTEHVAVDVGYAFVSTGLDYPFRIYGANDPSAAKLVNTQAVLRSAGRLAAYGGRLYVSERTGDWTSSVFNLANPALPSQVVVDPFAYSPYDFAFVGERAFIASERHGLSPWIIAPPESSDHSPSVRPPFYIGTQGGSAWSIVLSGHYALMGTSNSWFNVVDLSRAAQGSLTVVAATPTQSTPSTDREARRIALAGNFAFVANELAGVRVVDIAKPEFPAALAGYGASPGQIAAVAVYGSYVFAADTASGLVAYEASNPRGWAVGKMRDWAQPTATPAFDLVVRGSYAYVAYGTGGLGIWEISDPLSPTLVGSIQAAGFEPRSIVVYGDYLYATDGATKLYTVSLRP